jgi:hypothetical protein
LKARRFSRGRVRDGYVSLLAVTFAFGLASLGTAVAVSVRAYLNAAARQERDILDRIALESATTLRIGALSEAGTLPADFRNAPVVVGRSVTIEISMPAEKVDLAADSTAEVVGELERVVLKPAPPVLAEARASGALSAFSARLGLTAHQEDCVRRRMTFGRAPGPRLTEPLLPGQSLSPGDHVDVRAEIIRGAEHQVMWTRVRFTGNPASPWRVHDYRRLQTDGHDCGSRGR